ncbi:MAG: hypothetical protein U0935_14895 [Pirellulales bacterium]
MFRPFRVGSLLLAITLVPLARGIAQDENEASPSDLASPAAVGTPGEICCDAEDDGCCLNWTVRGGILFLQRSRPETAVLVTDSFAPGGNVLLNAHELNLGWSAGGELDVIRHRLLDSDWDLQVRVFSLDDWNANRGAVASPGGSVVQYPLPIGNTFFPGNISASLASELHSAELNLRRPTNDWLTLMAGLRYVELGESGMTIFQDIGPGLNLATHRIQAHNHLFGFQLGAEALLLERGNFEVSAVGKVGIYANSSDNSVLITQNVGPTFASSAREITPPCGRAGDRRHLRVERELVLARHIPVAAARRRRPGHRPGRRPIQPLTAATVDDGTTVFYHGEPFWASSIDVN